MRSTSQAIRRAFSLVELLVVIGVIGLLVSILLPILSKAREAANTVKCLSNLRQLGQANTMYVSQWNYWAVPGLVGDTNTPDNRVTWQNNNELRRNIGLPEWVPGNAQKDRAPDGLLCPAATQARESDNGAGGLMSYSYGYNIRHVNYDPKPLIVTLPNASEWDRNTVFAGIKANRVKNPAQKIQFMDSMTLFVEPQHSNHYLRIDGYDDYGEGPISGPVVLCAYRHSRERKTDAARINIVFWDGHAETMSRGEVAAVRVPQQSADVDGPPANRTPAWNRHWELGTP